MMRTRSILVLLTFLGGPRAVHAQSASTDLSPGQRIEEWILRLPFHTGVVGEAIRFEAGEQRLDAAFAEAQSRRVRNAALEAVHSRVDQVLGEGCIPSVEVDFPEPSEWSLPGLDPPQRAFLNGFVRTVAVACFQSDAPPAQALDLYTSPAFRMEAESRIERMWEEDQNLCILTGGVPLLLAPTEACNRVDRLIQPDLAVEHSQVVRNSTDKGIQPVFFKESLKTFLKTPDGLAFIYVNFSRSTDLGRASRWVARGKIRESQEGQAEALRRRIGG